VNRANTLPVQGGIAISFGAFTGFAVLCALLAIAAYPSLAWMVVHDWFDSEDYSHGALVPLIAAYLVRQRIDAFVLPAKGSRVGLGLVTIGLAAVLLGNLSTIHTLAQYGFLVCVYGAFAVSFGMPALRRCALPLLVLVFMIPLPNFLYQPLSAHLQLLSSDLGVALIRVFGISVLWHGNVIDLGTYQLQVLEACNGLRYLFPLLSLGCLAGYLFKGPTWQRVWLFLSAIPIAIFLNGIRIAAIGVAVEHLGVGAAEGFIHDIEGWAVFMACVGVLLLEAKILARMNGMRGRLITVFDTALPPTPKGVYSQPLPSRAIYAMTAAIVCAATVLGATYLRGHTTVILQRQSFAEFPMTLDGDWSGRREVIDQKYLDVLKLDDYVMANYVSKGVHDGARVGFYAAFYGSQLAGRSVHSPRSCLPGDGWEVSNLDTIRLKDASGKLVPVNRALIVRGAESQLVYYWFEQRGRVLANEYLVKWFILMDALSRRRTDGALIRMIAPISTARGIEQADATLVDFFDRVKPRLSRFVPG
jgi:exosortase D (VPLPA-CTERM-specific)